MRVFRFLVALLLTILLVWQLHSPQQLGTSRIPALGDFFNPFTGFWQNAEPADITGILNGPLSIPGLKQPVQVVYDDLKVPHIFAENLADAIMAQGYVTAQNRLWQMDISTRQTSGRLSEVLGARTLHLDKLARRRGLLFAAENDWKAWQTSPETALYMEAYAAGVNAWIDQLTPADYPLEFKLLGYAPEPWSPLKTALVVESMIDALNKRDNDLAATNSLAVFGRDTFNYLYPLWNPRQQPIVPDTGQWKGLNVSLPEMSAQLPATTQRDTGIPDMSLPSAFRDFYGSNNWAVSGARTRSGYPILANDTHLPLKLPHVWFQQQLHTPERNCYGVVVPGVPGIAIGFNEEIAWGFTNVSQEVVDWYLIDWTDQTRTAYRIDGAPQQADLRVERIAVKGQPDVLDTVRYTIWGPVVYDDPEHPLYNCAYRYVTHDAPTPESLGQFLNIGRAKTYTDYRNAIPGLDCLAQNVAFASHSGDIAITVEGKFPVRAREQGRFILDGSQSANAWHGFVPQEDLPALLNPSRGFVFSANQHSTPPSYPYFYLGNFDDNRGRRIFNRLEHMQGVTADSMKSIQLDNYNQLAADALPIMLQLLDRTALEAADQEWLKALDAWKYEYKKDLIAPSLFEMWFQDTYLLTWDEQEAFRQQKIDVLFPEGWRFIELLTKDTTSVFFDRRDTPERETARNIVTQAFREMSQKAREKGQEALTWSVFKGFAIRHLTSQAAFSRLGLQTSGSRNTPNAIGQDHGPSFRMVVELTQPVKAWGVYPGGQSGNPGSAYYDNMIDTWVEGNYFELLLLERPDAIPDNRLLVRQTLLPK
ncbi:MAG: penicillin acylase family protein [Bacteroidetes bacterium]|nr:MAG: penicillin acylase family protein [Bacteroidota bacterium]